MVILVIFIHLSLELLLQVAAFQAKRIIGMESLHVAADHDAALMIGSNISHLTWLLIVVMICKPLSNLIQLVCMLAMLENSWFEQWEVRLERFFAIQQRTQGPTHTRIPCDSHLGSQSYNHVLSVFIYLLVKW